MRKGGPTTLAAVCESVRYGYTASANELAVGPHFLRITDIVRDSVDWDSVPYCEIDDDDRERFGLSVGDIVVARTGATVGHAKLITEQVDAVFASYLVRFRVDKTKADPNFVGQLVQSQAYRAFVHSRVGGAAQPNASAPVLGAFEFGLPSLSIQQRIALDLSDCDKLIANNRRRMSLLEDAARNLYREWFVSFRFPGHEHAPISNGVPEGWSTQRLDSLCEVGRGASPRPIADFMGGDIPWFKIGDATDSESPFVFTTEEQVTESGALKSVLLAQGSMILSNSATCGIPFFTAVPGCIHDGWLHFSKFRRISERFLYCFLYFKKEELVSSVSDGSTQKNLNTAAVSRLTAVLPPTDFLIEQFEDAARQLFSQVLNLATQNERLRFARDLLVPRLMSGELAG